MLRRPIETTQYASWAFGQRLRKAGLLGSMGTVGDALDNAVAESFFATLQTELLDRRPRWSGRAELARAMFDYIETFYNPVRRHSSCDMLSPADYDRTRRTYQAAAACALHRNRPRKRGAPTFQP